MGEERTGCIVKGKMIGRLEADANGFRIEGTHRAIFHGSRVKPYEQIKEFISKHHGNPVRITLGSNNLEDFDRFRILDLEPYPFSLQPRRLQAK